MSGFDLNNFGPSGDLFAPTPTAPAGVTTLTPADVAIIVQALQPLFDAQTRALLGAIGAASGVRVSSPTPGQYGAASAFTVMRRDTLPGVTLHLLDGTGNPIALPPGTTVRFHMASASRVRVNAPAQIVDTPSALVAYLWQPGDTDVSGTYNAEFEVTFPDGGVETFPDTGNLSVLIPPDVA